MAWRVSFRTCDFANRPLVFRYSSILPRFGSRKSGVGGLGFRVRVERTKTTVSALGGLTCLMYTTSVSPERIKLNPSILLFLFRKMRWGEKLQRRVHNNAKGEGDVSSNDDVGRVNLIFILFSLFSYSHSFLILSYYYLIFIFFWSLLCSRIVFLCYFCLLLTLPYLSTILFLLFYAYLTLFLFYLITILFLLFYAYLTLLLFFSHFVSLSYDTPVGRLLICAIVRQLQILDAAIWVKTDFLNKQIYLSFSYPYPCSEEKQIPYPYPYPGPDTLPFQELLPSARLTSGQMHLRVLTLTLTLTLIPNPNAYPDQP
jgi:hypothetical protein